MYVRTAFGEILIREVSLIQRCPLREVGIWGNPY